MRLQVLVFSMLALFSPLTALASERLTLPAPKLMLGSIKLEPNFVSMPGFGIKLSLKF